MNRRKRQAGAAMLETALFFTVAVSMVIFIMDMGRLLLVEQFISERARSTARAAAVNNWDSTAVKNYFLYNNTTAPQGATGGFLGLLPSQITYQKLGTAGNADYRVQVAVSNVPLLVFVPYMAGTYQAPPVVATFAAQSLGSTN